MGLEGVASSTLAYGVVVKMPSSPNWSLMLKRLGEIKDEKFPAATKKEDDSAAASSTKRMKTMNSILVSYESDEESKDDKGCDDSKKKYTKECEWGDPFASLNYLDDHDDEIQEATRNALDKVLGPGHGLVLKAYSGHDEDACEVSLMLQVEDDTSCKVSSYQGVEMTPVAPFMRNENEEKTDTLTKKALDTLIKKAVNLFGLQIENEQAGPGWIMATECKLYR